MKFCFTSSESNLRENLKKFQNSMTNIMALLNFFFYFFIFFIFYFFENDWNSTKYWTKNKIYSISLQDDKIHKKVTSRDFYLNISHKIFFCRYIFCIICICVFLSIVCLILFLTLIMLAFLRVVLPGAVWRGWRGEGG